MANGSINLVNLDFQSLKSSLKEYLSSQSTFRDYDFSGSNINVLLDVLSYNTYINSFYLNMVGNEMFLDTAQLRESVISHAKELNYTPRSFRSASARINVSVVPSSNAVTTVNLMRGLTFTSKVGSNTYTFTLPDNIAISGSSNGVFTASNVEIYEGSLVTDTYIYNSTNTSQRFILSNPTIDTTSLRVYVTEDNAANVLTYSLANTYLGIDSSSQVYFIQGAEQDLYELKFGNGTQGRKPKHGSAVSAVYRVGNGELPNGAATFSCDDGIDGHTNVAITTVEVAVGGKVHETTQEIRTNAPRFYQTQERAVTALDYRTLLQLAYPEITSINVYGGEQEDPPRYGKVVISADVAQSDGIAENKKTIWFNFLKDKCPLTIDPVFVDPEYLNLEVTSSVGYNMNNTSRTENDLKAAILTKIRVFNEVLLDDFNITFRYSRLVADIDDVDVSIISNNTDIIMYKDLNIPLRSDEPFKIEYLNAVKILNVESSAITSTYFVFRGNLSRLLDDGNGNINVVSQALVNGVPASITKVGTVNYTTGIINITGLNITSYQGDAIRVKAIAGSKDITASRNNIIRIKDSDINITLTGTRSSTLII
jgi:hypothetical protein